METALKDIKRSADHTDQGRKRHLVSPGDKADEYQVISELGRGTYGVVAKVRSRRDGRIYVLKKIRCGHLTPQRQRDALLEVVLLRRLDHPNIIGYYTSFVEKKNLHIVMEYAPNGDLQATLDRYKRQGKMVSETEVWRIIGELISALQHLHKKRIMHRDLKMVNVFLGHDNKVKLGDLGVSRILDKDDDMAMSRVGTPLYLAPELIKRQPYDFKADVWSTGVMLYTLCAQRGPFKGNNIYALGYSIVHELPSPIPPHYSSGLSTLIMSMLEKSPLSRPSVDQILLKIRARQSTRLSSTEAEEEASLQSTVPSPYPDNAQPGPSHRDRVAAQDLEDAGDRREGGVEGGANASTGGDCVKKGKGDGVVGRSGESGAESSAPGGKFRPTSANARMQRGQPQHHFTSALHSMCPPSGVRSPSNDKPAAGSSTTAAAAGGGAGGGGGGGGGLTPGAFSGVHPKPAPEATYQQQQGHGGMLGQLDEEDEAKGGARLPFAGGGLVRGATRRVEVGSGGGGRGSSGVYRPTSAPVVRPVTAGGGRGGWYEKPGASTLKGKVGLGVRRGPGGGGRGGCVDVAGRMYGPEGAAEKLLLNDAVGGGGVENVKRGGWMKEDGRRREEDEDAGIIEDESDGGDDDDFYGAAGIGGGGGGAKSGSEIEHRNRTETIGGGGGAKSGSGAALAPPPPRPNKGFGGVMRPKSPAFPSSRDGALAGTARPKSPGGVAGMMSDKHTNASNQVSSTARQQQQQQHSNRPASATVRSAGGAGVAPLASVNRPASATVRLGPISVTSEGSVPGAKQQQPAAFGAGAEIKGGASEGVLTPLAKSSLSSKIEASASSSMRCLDQGPATGCSKIEASASSSMRGFTAASGVPASSSSTSMQRSSVMSRGYVPAPPAGMQEEGENQDIGGGRATSTSPRVRKFVAPSGIEEISCEGGGVGGSAIPTYRERLEYSPPTGRASEGVRTESVSDRPRPESAKPLGGLTAAGGDANAKSGLMRNRPSSAFPAMSRGGGGNGGEGAAMGGRVASGAGLGLQGVLGAPGGRDRRGKRGPSVHDLLNA